MAKVPFKREGNHKLSEIKSVFNKEISDAETIASVLGAIKLATEFQNSAIVVGLDNESSKNNNTKVRRFREHNIFVVEDQSLEQ